MYPLNVDVDPAPGITTSESDEGAFVSDPNNPDDLVSMDSDQLNQMNIN